jgi:hypothetical protein
LRPMVWILLEGCTLSAQFASSTAVSLTVGVLCAAWPLWWHGR